MVGPQRPQFVLFGSSIVQFSFGDQGWGAILADLYSRTADIVVRGYAGWNTRLAIQVLDQVFPKDAAVQPSLVIVYFGGNDSIKPLNGVSFNPHVPLPEYVENMRKIGLHLKSLSPTTRVIFLAAPPVSEQQIRTSYDEALANARTIEGCRIYSEACLKLCRELDIKGVDLWSALQQRDDWKTACFTDGIHLTPQGSKILVKEILKVLQEADWEPSLYWKSMPVEFANGVCIEVNTPDGKVTLNTAAIDAYRAQMWELYNL